MGFEINFIGIPEETKDADAIALRWEKQNGDQIIGVYNNGCGAPGIGHNCTGTDTDQRRGAVPAVYAEGYVDGLL